ncbi:archaeosortase/exosortase family protein [Segetibacter aerophilus]|uniref:Exosortase family protein XrtF n=1 Tax=Segetibacter aerophilus TaxID=670293 RepID=A0A512BDC2_9BACT|nr:archaeosortase/exosortase family protein [Segetibacter aerophilus]GEO09895.1 hypothetical protein SAE01_23910 [Segetibacter aerophilus]
MIKNIAPTSFIKQMPADTRAFLVKALIIFLAWKLLYHLVLFPVRIPDQQLTFATASAAAFLYSNLMDEKMIITEEKVNKQGMSYIAVHAEGKKLVAIADSCNGLELIVLYIGFLCCFPPNLKRQLPYIMFGTIAVVVLNAFRCYGLTWMYMHNFPLADFFHKYIFKMAIYGIVFTIWLKYSKRHLHV